MIFGADKWLYTAEYVVGLNPFLFPDYSQSPKLAHLDGMFHPLVGVSGDKNLSWPGIGFEALGRVHLVADHSVVGSPFGTNIARDHNSCVDTDAHVQAYLGKFYKCYARQSFLNGQGAVHSTQRIILA